MPSQKSFRRPRRVWRISDASPLGEWVDSSVDNISFGIEESEPIMSGWAASTLDLQHGADVREFGDTVPNEFCEWAEVVRKEPT